MLVNRMAYAVHATVPFSCLPIDGSVIVNRIEILTVENSSRGAALRRVINDEGATMPEHQN